LRPVNHKVRDTAFNRIADFVLFTAVPEKPRRMGSDEYCQIFPMEIPCKTVYYVTNDIKK